MKNHKIRVWHLIVFNLFFSFSGSFVALYLGVDKPVENLIEVLFSTFFVIFLLIIMPDIRRFLFNINMKNLLPSIIAGILAGLLLWFTMVLYIPLNQLTLDSCNLELCSTLLDKYYTFNSTGKASRMSEFLMISMIIKFVIIAPIREELLYRSAMSVLFNKRYTIVMTSIFVAIVFAIFHLRYFVFMMGYSLVMSAMVLKYRNILPAVIAHGIYNGIIFFLYPSKAIISHYSNLGLFEISLVIFLLINIFFWSCFVISRQSLDWLHSSERNE